MNLRTFQSLVLLFLLSSFFLSCTDEEALNSNDKISYRDNNDCSTVTLSYPTTVNVSEDFTIDADIECGRVAIEIAYILVGLDTVYTDLSCATPDLQWQAVTNFQCYTNDASATQSHEEPGIYVYRTKHNASDGNCDNFNPPGPGNPGECTGFNGNNFCCFEIEVVENCVIEAGDYWTYSHGFFSNNNGEAFLDAHPELGPVNVGCGANVYSYTLDSIANMSPNGNAAPGILVKQIITMTLNVNASSFLASGEDLGCLVVVADDDPLTTIDDLFEGMTVNEVIAAANAYVGGCDTTTFSAGDMTAILGAMVSNFHLGEVNLGLLTCCE